MVNAPARTGRLNNRRKTVTDIAHLKSLIVSTLITWLCILTVVTAKFSLPTKLLRPLICREKIRESTLISGVPLLDKGGYNTQDTPTPVPMNIVRRINTTLPPNTQTLKEFIRGYLISGAERTRGRIRFPKPPTSAGITAKKIIIIPCRVSTLL